VAPPSPPADLFTRPAYPEIPAEALTDERAYEAWREDGLDWGKRLDAGMYDACAWVKAVVWPDLDCGAKPEWINEGPPAAR
jgi:hypothetical protein